MAGSMEIDVRNVSVIFLVICLNDLMELMADGIRVDGTS